MATGNFKIGKMDVPKPAIYIAGAAALGIVAYAYYKRGSGGVETPADTGTAVDIDPTTGLPYGDGFDYSSGYGGASGVGIYDPVSGGYINNGYGQQTVTAVTTNAAWAQAAQAYLTTIGQYDPSAVAIALGKALTGQYVTADQVSIFSAARAFQGEPPQGYPPLNTRPPAGQPSTGGTPTGKGPVSGLKVKKTGWSYVDLDWNPVSGAKGYILDHDGHRSVSVVYSSGRVAGLARKHRYTIGVTPIMSNGQSGTRKTVSATTK